MSRPDDPEQELREILSFPVLRVVQDNPTAHELTEEQKYAAWVDKQTEASREILEEAKLWLHGPVLVIGVNKDGRLQVSTACEDAGRVLWYLKHAERMTILGSYWIDPEIQEDAGED